MAPLRVLLVMNQKAADIWKKDVWDFQAFSQTFFELRYSPGNEGKDGKNLSSQTWPGTPRRPSPRHLRPPEWNSKQYWGQSRLCAWPWGYPGLAFLFRNLQRRQLKTGLELRSHWPVTDRENAIWLEMKNLGHSEKKIFNKHFQGANSELNSLYFPRKTPWTQKNGRI